MAMTLFSAVGQADTTQNSQAMEPPTVVTGPDYSPYADEGLPAGGLSTRIVRAVFHRMGQEVNIVFLPWRRGYEMTLQHKYLGTFPYVWDAVRAEKFLYSRPITDASERFFVHKDSQITYTGPENLRDQLVCRPVGYSLEALGPNVIEDEKHLWRPTNLSKCFQMLAHKRVDLVPMNELVGWHTISEMGLNPQDFEVMDYEISQNNHHFIVARDYPQAERIISEFDAALESMVADGTLNRIIENYMARYK